MNVYSLYSREDALCQSNGYFSINVRKGCIPKIERLLQLDEKSCVGWVGFGDGRELFSIAQSYPHTQFVGFEINPSAFYIANRVLNQMKLNNVVLYHQDIMTWQKCFTHIYSTAISGKELYDYLQTLCIERICVLQEMWTETSTDISKEKIYLSGSGEVRQLCAGSPIKRLQL